MLRIMLFCHAIACKLPYRDCNVYIIVNRPPKIDGGDKFALELDIVNRCYSDLLTSEPIPETSKTPFTEEEINAVWGIASTPWADSVLAFLYTGFRISELLDLRISNVNLAEGTIQGGTKTRAGNCI